MVPDCSESHRARPGPGHEPHGWTPPPRRQRHTAKFADDHISSNWNEDDAD